MARIGVLPTKTSLQLRDGGDGGAGTLPAATPTAAGVMTAHQVQMLEEVWQSMQSGGSASAPVIIERAADTSHLVTRDELKALLAVMPRAMDMTPQLHALRGEIETLRIAASDGGQRALPGPSVDHGAREILDHVLAGFEQMEARLRAVEAVTNTIRALADIKGEAA